MSENDMLYVPVSAAERDQLLECSIIASSLMGTSLSPARMVLDGAVLDNPDLQNAAERIAGEGGDLQAIVESIRDIFARAEPTCRTKPGDEVAFIFSDKELWGNSIAMRQVVDRLTQAARVFECLHRGFQEKGFLDSQPDGVAAICDLVGQTIDETVCNYGETVTAFSKRLKP